MGYVGLESLTYGVLKPRLSYSITDLGTLGGTISYASGINDSGQVAGWSFIAGNAAAHAFFYDGTTMNDLNAMIPVNSGWSLFEAITINDSGQITGFGTMQQPVPRLPADAGGYRR